MNLSPTVVAEIFRACRNNYNLGHSSFLSVSYVTTVYHGSESLSNLGLRIWNLVQSTLKELDDIHSFKTHVEKGQPENCSCILCKTHIPYVGVI